MCFGNYFQFHVKIIYTGMILICMNNKYEFTCTYCWYSTVGWYYIYSGLLETLAKLEMKLFSYFKVLFLKARRGHKNNDKKTETRIEITSFLTQKHLVWWDTISCIRFSSSYFQSYCKNCSQCPKCKDLSLFCFTD